MPADDYIPRDRCIVDSTEYPVGAPKVTDREEPHSGSWYTIRYAHTIGRPHHVLAR
jgi:hypothetical protein